MTITVKWIDGGKEPSCQPDPRYPEGIDLRGPGVEPTCRVVLPYPAKRIGWYAVLCEDCGQSIVVTTAGRPDDPRSLMMSCAPKPGKVQ